jgi:hypothetical protein
MCTHITEFSMDRETVMNNLLENLEILVNEFVAGHKLVEVLSAHILNQAYCDVITIQTMTDLLDRQQLCYRNIAYVDDQVHRIHNQFRRYFLSRKASRQIEPGMPKQFRVSTQQFKYSRNVRAVIDIRKDKMLEYINDVLNHSRQVSQ